MPTSTKWERAIAKRRKRTTEQRTETLAKGKGQQRKNKINTSDRGFRSSTGKQKDSTRRIDKKQRQ